MAGAAQGIGQAEAYLFGGGLTLLLIDGGQNGGAYSLHETRMPPGTATPPHVHEREDETAYVVSGVLTVETEGRVLELREGQSKWMKRGIPHCLSNRGASDVRYLVLCAPAGFEDFVRETGMRVEGAGPAVIPPMTEAERVRLAEAMPRFGIQFVREGAL